MRLCNLASVAFCVFGATAPAVDRAALAEERPAAPHSSMPIDGPFRTMCVRLCDGYYFPVRTYAQAKDFAVDAQRCKATCSSPAELYVDKTLGGAPSTMADLAGRKYTELPTAFLFKKEFKPDCVCKPPAWSEEALARHRAYAERELAPAVEIIAAAPHDEPQANGAANDFEVLSQASEAAGSLTPPETPYLSQRAREREMRRRAALEAPSRRTSRSFRLIDRYNVRPIQRAFAN